MAHRRAGHAALGIEITSRHTIRPRPQSRGLALSVVPYPLDPGSLRVRETMMHAVPRPQSRGLALSVVPCPLDPGSLRVRETQESGLEFSPYRPRRRAS